MNLIIILRSKSSIYSPSAQGFVLKATASTCSQPKPVGQVNQKAGSSGIQNRSRSTFSGKRVSNRQPYRDMAAPLSDGKHIEDAFWKKKPLRGRQVTTTDVLAAYGHDRSSIRSAFFLQKLCLQNILHNHRKVTPDQVIQEFNRVPDRNNKYKLAKARFKAECCMRGLVLNGQQVTADAVIKDFPESPEGKLGIARFKADCCLKGLSFS
uniref:hypothetical protein n=1 Tax=Endozoicomonas sp. SESOKO1 TaxID=2828742 RepID=UPI0021482F40